MGIKLTARDTVAPWNSKVIPPVNRGLEGFFTFDTDASRFSRNRAIDKADAVVIGAPVAFPGYGRFKGLTNYIQTSISETDEQTIIVVGRAVAAIPAGASAGGDATTPFYVGNYQGASATPGVPGSAFGASLYHVAPATMTGIATRNNGSGAGTSAAVSLSGETPTDWSIRVLRTRSGAPTEVRNVTKGISLSGGNSNTRVLTDTKFRIGSATSGFAAEVDISFVGIHSVYLTDAELAAQVAAIRKRMARLGISV
ncbi:MAG: hypothetical protein K0S85_1319 [Pseudomonas orientalis]|nr:hypothetical protein [Pseudomonas orientalis]